MIFSIRSKIQPKIPPSFLSPLSFPDRSFLASFLCTLRKIFFLYSNSFVPTTRRAQIRVLGATYDFARILIALLTASAFLPLRNEAARVKENYCHRKFNQNGRVYSPRRDPSRVDFPRCRQRIFPPSLFPFSFPPRSLPLHRDICVKATYVGVPTYDALRALCVPNTRNYAQKLIRSIRRYHPDHPSISRAISIHRERHPGEGDGVKEVRERKSRATIIQP